MAVTGQRMASTTLATDQRVVDMAEEIFNPEFGGNDEAPFMTLLNNIKGRKRVVTNVKFEQMEENSPRRRITAAGGGSTDSCIILTDSADLAYVPRYTVLYHYASGERLYVKTTATSGVSLATVRDFGTAVGSSADVASGDIFFILGNQREEGGISEDAISEIPTTSHNYVGFLRTPVEISEHQKHQKLYGGPDWPRLQKMAAFEHKQQLERLAWLSVRYTGTDPTSNTTKQLWTPGGVLQHIKGNIFDLSAAAYGGQITEKAMDTWAEMCFLNGSSTKYVFCGGRFIAGLTAQVRNRLRVIDGKSKSSYGLSAIQEYVTPYGVFKLVKSPKIFGTDPTISGGTLASSAVCLDIEQGVKIVELEGMGTKLFTNIQANDRSGQKDEWRSTISIDMRGYGLDHAYNTSSGVPEEYAGLHSKLTGFSGY